jgi:hypothetical protein
MPMMPMPAAVAAPVQAVVAELDPATPTTTREDEVALDESYRSAIKDEILSFEKELQLIRQKSRALKVLF